MSIKIIAYKNGIKSNGVELTVSSTLQELLTSITESLQLDSPAKRIFRINGAEVLSISDISDGEFLFASTGEDFIPVDSAGLKGSSSSGLDDEEEEVGANLEQMDFDAKAIGFDKLPSHYQSHLQHSLEDGEKVLWADTPVKWQPFLRFLLMALLVLGFAGLMAGLISEWRVAIFVMTIAMFAVVMIAFVASTVTHEYYALTTRRILILHAGCGPGWFWCKKDVKRSPVFQELTNFQIEVEEQLGIGSVLFRSTNLGFKFVNNAPEVAEMVKRRIPEAPPRALLKF
eukprot:TRINITY_DN9954_c0_g1_i1.p1 TRINITY_DN9954_c0_g1~~TRINITY_DN9954_c0_g1_i1.p1  ORF type:complete len:286 (+),score=74.97 TRINITY_DN9954_c0_g1_i1:106-963(+)